MAKRPTNGQAWKRLWEGICELNEQFESRLVFIGGVAVYLHISRDKPEFAEFSHDGDFYISIVDFGQLRELEEVSDNWRLKKHQVIKHGIDYDIYVERQHSLVVTFEEIEGASIVVGGDQAAGPSCPRVRVASVEHLLALKLPAYRDRRGRSKGEKDERDIIRLVYLLRNGARQNLIGRHLTKDNLLLLRDVATSRQFEVIAGNPHHAAKLKQIYMDSVDKLISQTPWNDFMPWRK